MQVSSSDKPPITNQEFRKTGTLFSKRILLKRGTTNVKPFLTTLFPPYLVRRASKIHCGIEVFVPDTIGQHRELTASSPTLASNSTVSNYTSLSNKQVAVHPAALCSSSLPHCCHRMAGATGCIAPTLLFQIASHLLQVHKTDSAFCTPKAPEAVAVCNTSSKRT